MDLCINESKRNVVKVITAIFIVLFSFTGISTNVSAAESSGAVTNDTSIYSSFPTEVYVTEGRSFSKNYAIPPARVYEARTINGFRYGGMINRFSYADAGERWLANYKGYIRAL